jgi:hypothetical protein
MERSSDRNLVLLIFQHSSTVASGSSEKIVHVHDRSESAGFVRPELRFSIAEKLELRGTV